MQKCRKIITVSVIISMSFSSSSPAPNELNFIDCNVASMIARDFLSNEIYCFLKMQKQFYKIESRNKFHTHNVVLERGLFEYT